MWEEIGSVKRFAGASGTVSVKPGNMIIKIQAHASTGSATVVFNDGQGGVVTVPVPNGAWWEYDPKHKSSKAGVAGAQANIVFTNTDSYFVEVTGTGF